MPNDETFCTAEDYRAALLETRAEVERARQLRAGVRAHPIVGFVWDVMFLDLYFFLKAERPYRQLQEKAKAFGYYELED